MVWVRVNSSPRSSSISVSESAIDVTGRPETVTRTDALSPVSMVATMRVLPAARAVILPFASTEATYSLSLDHVMTCSIRFTGAMETDTVFVSPGFMDSVPDGESVSVYRPSAAAEEARARNVIARTSQTAIERLRMRRASRSIESAILYIGRRKQSIYLKHLNEK